MPNLIDRISTFERDGLSFDVIDSGPLDGTPVVLLHGFPQRATSWSGVAEVLNSAGYRTFAPDQRGYSPGARPKSVLAYRMKELRADVAALIDVIGQPVHLVGHDWGAAVAWATAMNHADKILSLTAVSVGHVSAYLRSFVTSNQLVKSYYMNIFSVPGLAERLLSKRGGWFERWGAKGGTTPEMFERFHRDIVDYGALTGGLNWYRALLPSLADKRTKVSVPTSMVWSTGDVALGRKQAELTEKFVTGPYELVVMDDVSHWIPEERPVELAEVIIRRIRSV